VSGSRWAGATGGAAGQQYAARFAALASAGADVHGEATFCASLIPPGARVLDAGCGTGRVAARLAELGYDCVGVDNDTSMLDIARESSDAVRWVFADLADLRDLGGPFDLVVAAGNVIPFLASGTEPVVIKALAARLVTNGLFVAGFGLDTAHLPLVAPSFDLADYDGWCADADLEVVARYSTWAKDPYAGGGYAVSVCRLNDSRR
jgi:SAM-dependent methyltransferase